MSSNYATRDCELLVVPNGPTIQQQSKTIYFHHSLERWILNDRLGATTTKIVINHVL
jgi:hypothetical protein